MLYRKDDPLVTIISDYKVLGRGHTKETGNRNATAISEN
jgi:hypothetical protein